MRRARVLVHGIVAGYLTEEQTGGPFRFDYEETYDGKPISLTMPLAQSLYRTAEATED